MAKELFYGYDIEAIFLDKRLDAFQSNLLIHLILISIDPTSIKRVWQGQTEYEVPIKLLQEKTGRAMGGIGEILRHLDACGYITFSLLPGSTGRRCYQVILHGEKEAALLRSATLTPHKDTQGNVTYQIRLPDGSYGVLYPPETDTQART